MKPSALVLFARLVMAVGLPLAATTSALAQATVPELTKAGWEAIQRDDGNAAASIFQQALAMKPRDPVLHLGAGAAAHLRGRESEAVASLKQALALAPGLTPAALLLGEIAYHQGDLETAISTYEKALASAPGNADISNRLDRWRAEAALHHDERRNDRFRIVFEGQPEEKLAIRASVVLELAFWRIGKAIGVFPNDPVKVVFYTAQQFVDITRAPKWSTGAFDGIIRIPVRGAAEDLQQFDRILTHELTHAIVRSVAPRGVPTWIHEGLAQHFEGVDEAAAIRRLQTLGQVPLANLQGGFNQLTEAQARLAYDESLVAVRVLMDQGGLRVGLLLQNIGEGQAFPQALQRVGLNYEDFESALARRVLGTR